MKINKPAKRVWKVSFIPSHDCPETAQFSHYPTEKELINWWLTTSFGIKLGRGWDYFQASYSYDPGLLPGQDRYFIKAENTYQSIHISILIIEEITAFSP